MNGTRFDALSRRLGGVRTRRGLLRAAAGLALMVYGLLVPVTPVATAREGAYGGRLGGRHGQNRRGRDPNRDNAKGKDKGNDKRKRPAAAAPPPPTCAASCSSKCPLCVEGPGAPTRCASSVSSLNIFCSIGCDSDDYCQAFRPDYPYCVAQWVDRGTGQVTRAADGCAGIAPPRAAYCAQIAPCA